MQFLLKYQYSHPFDGDYDDEYELIKGTKLVTADTLDEAVLKLNNHLSTNLRLMNSFMDDDGNMLLEGIINQTL